MVICKTIFVVKSLDIYFECFGGNDNGGIDNKNFDLGDAFKGATTDAITKIGSWMGVGGDVFKGLGVTEKPKIKPVAKKISPLTEKAMKLNNLFKVAGKSRPEEVSAARQVLKEKKEGGEITIELLDNYIKEFTK